MKVVTFALATTLVATGLPQSVSSKEKRPPPSEPAIQPNWAEVRTKVEVAVRESMYDPASAKISWTSGFKWSAVKPILMRSSWGWVGCISLNGKNQYGGYVGSQIYWVRYTPEGLIEHGIAGDTSLANGVRSQCDNAERQPLQDALTGERTSAGDSVANDLSKMAELLEKGLITRTEFDTQKAKLLGVRH